MTITDLSLSPVLLSSECRIVSPGLGGRELLEVVQRRRHVQQLLVESQWEVEVHHGGVVDGQAADDPDQVKPVLLHKTLKDTHTRNKIICFILTL